MSAFDSRSTGRRNNTPYPGGKDGGYADTSRIFSSLHYGRENDGFGIAGSVRKTLGFKPQQKE
jgi:hypothetical protein